MTIIDNKPMGESRTISTRLVLPPDMNNHHTIFGGKIMAYIDEIAAITSMKHAQAPTVTASIDSLDFVSPAVVGDVLELEGIVCATGRTSMAVFVSVYAKNLITGERNLTTKSFITMVAIDENGRPKPVAKVYPETEMEKSLFETAPARRENRRIRQQMRH